MTPEQLKASILQMAIEGKLVKQRPEEGTAEGLYQQIQVEKQKLFDAGKLKKQKPLPEITEDEIPFDIPDNWIWTKFGDCTTYSQSKNKITAPEIKENTWTLDLEDIQKNTGKVISFVTLNERKINGDKVKFYKGQILYSKLRPYLKKVLIAPEDGVCTPELVPFSGFNINSKYLNYYLISPYVDFVVNSVTYGVKMPRVGTTTISNLLLPLPPSGEQERIVAKIEELMPLVERYRVAYDRLQKLNAEFPEKLKKSILQYAIQGKLVEQRPEEGTAEDLYKQIQAEKEKLISSGKLKKQVSVSESLERDTPFSLPLGWKWYRLTDMATVNGGYAFKSSNYTNVGVRVIRISDFNQNGFIDNNIVRHKYSEDLEPFIIDLNSIILCMTGGTVGKSYFVDKLDEKMVTNQRVATIKPIGVVNEYINYVTLSPLVQKIIHKSKTSTNDNISMKTICSFPMPLPPLQEQRRIVLKVHEFLNLLAQM